MSSDGEDHPMELDYSSLALIAKPLSTPKLQRRLLKLVKKSAKDKSLKRGVKEVVKSIRKNVKGIVILAGDVSPIDVLSHVPVLCEEASIPFVYVSSKAELGIAGSTRRPTCCVLIPSPKTDSESRKNFDKCAKEMMALSS